MNSSNSIVARRVVLLLLTSGGCAQSGDLARVQRENAELKVKVALLESQVAELRSTQQPLVVPGLTLAPLQAGELRLAMKYPTSADAWPLTLGSQRLINGV